MADIFTVLTGNEPCRNGMEREAEFREEDYVLRFA